ncbi:pilus assembly PilX N-terminal domain-containing protein [Niallia oryzisoli]|uniref:pilus assembly PilX N-terminal domain-containing protein n=1 Tax=Niallia oryzisoli TaxID=1737571 RepID=UPI003735B10E
MNERGSTLVQVLLVILIFSVIGISLIGNVVGESKRVDKTESNTQARNLALDGLTYFETVFKKFVDESAPLTMAEMNSFIDEYKDGKMVGNQNIQIKVEAPDRTQVADRDILKVSSTGSDGTSQTTVVGYYQLDFDIDFETPTNRISNFDDGGKAVDFANGSLLRTDLAYLLDLKLINPTGWDGRYYQVPQDGVIDISLLEQVVKLDLGDLLGGLFGGIFNKEFNRFKVMEENRVIATRQGQILGADVLKTKQMNLLSLNLFNLPKKTNTNVMINGYYSSLEVLGLGVLNGYQDINFKKFAVIGNAVIQHDQKGFIETDRDPKRRFTFNEGLYVDKTLVIGGVQWKNPATKLSDYSNLDLKGDMVAIEHFTIVDANVNFIDNDIFVHGQSEIKNSCVNSSGADFHLFSKGNVTMENNNNCSTFNGVYFSDNKINIKTNNKPMTIKGGLIGELTVDNPEMLTIIEDSEYLKSVNFSNIELAPQGRDVVEKK